MKIENHKLLFKAIVGSHSYGTDIEGSDIDYKGVFIQDPEDVLINGYIPQIEVSKDEVYFEVGRFLSLCETANPTVLELLFTPRDCVVYKDRLFNYILKHQDKFLTKKCKHSFGGYAVQQIRKARGLDKKMNWEKDKTVRKDILDFCYVHRGCGSIPVKDWLEEMGLEQKDMGLVAINHMRKCYGMLFDMHETNKDFKPLGIARNLLTSNDVVLTSIPKTMEQNVDSFLLYFNKEGYSSHCRDYKEYQDWLKNRNTQRYVDIEAHGQQIDGKNMLHCMRLIETAIEIPQEKSINVRRPNSKYLIEIRKGKHNLEEILQVCEQKLLQMDDAYDISDLPDECVEGYAKSLTIKIRKLNHEYRNNNNEPVY